MATCSRILAWKIPWTEEPGGLVSTGSRRIRYDRAHTSQQYKQIKKYQEKRGGYSSHPLLYEQNSTIVLAYIFFFSSVQFSTVTQSGLTLCNPMDCSLPGSSVHRISQARILEQVAISYSIYLYSIFEMIKL